MEREGTARLLNILASPNPKVTLQDNGSVWWYVEWTDQLGVVRANHQEVATIDDVVASDELCRRLRPQGSFPLDDTRPWLAHYSAVEDCPVLLQPWRSPRGYVLAHYANGDPVRFATLDETAAFKAYIAQRVELARIEGEAERAVRRMATERERCMDAERLARLEIQRKASVTGVRVVDHLDAVTRHHNEREAERRCIEREAREQASAARAAACKEYALARFRPHRKGEEGNVIDVEVVRHTPRLAEEPNEDDDDRDLDAFEMIERNRAREGAWRRMRRTRD